MISQFTVSEARSAIACPRILYFDEQRFRQGSAKTKRITRIWTGSTGTISGCGTLFHNTVERFNALAGKTPPIVQALGQAAKTADGQIRSLRIVEQCKRLIAQSCLNRVSFNAKSPPEQQAFIRAIDQYLSELADVLGYAVRHGRSPDELIQEFFGDSRKRVDVTFYVGQNDKPIRVRGALDYIYFDFRQESNRILDFKLLPAESISKDLLQASLYALMHDQQHGTRPNIAVMYLHPDRKMAEQPWSQVAAERHKVFDLLASMAAWVEYDEVAKVGLKPPGEPSLCPSCPWAKKGQCFNRLGPVVEGERITRWSELNSASASPPEPRIDKHEPPDPPPSAEYDEIEEGSEAGTEVAPSLDRNQPALATAPVNAAADHPTGLYLGATMARGLPVTMPVESLATHVSILGAAGSGKSWLAKVVAEEAIRHGVPVLAIDPQGDLVQFLRPAVLPAEASAAERAEQATFRDKAEVRVWTPGASHAQRLCLSPLRLPRQEDLQGVESPQRRREEWEAMLGVAAGNIVKLADAGGDEEVQKTFVLEILRQLTARIDDSGSIDLSAIIAGLAAPEALELEEAATMISKRDRDKLKQKLYARMRGPTANLFSGGTPLDLDRFVKPLDAGKTPLNVVYLNGLADDGQKQYFVASLAAEVYRWMITSASTGKVRLLLFLDEAKDFLPAGTSKPPAKDPLLRLFAQGRKFGLSCLICTQSPRSVDYQVFSNASTKLIGRLEAAQDVQRVAEWFREGDGAPAWLAGRNGAGKGSLIGRWPDITPELEGQEFRSRRLYSLHEGAWSVDRVEKEWAQSPLAARLNAE